MSAGYNDDEAMRAYAEAVAEFADDPRADTPRICYECHLYFENAIVRPAKVPGYIDLHCPHCDDQFAHWVADEAV